MKKLFLLTLLMSAVACSAKSSYEFATQTYPFKNFTKIKVNNSIKVVYTQSNSYKVQLKGRADWLKLIKVTSQDGTLTVCATNNEAFKNAKVHDKPDGEHNFVLEVSAPCLKDINLSSASSFESEKLTPDELTVHLKGASHFKSDNIKCSDIRLDLDGASSITAGDIICSQLQTNATGASHIEAKRLNTKAISVTASGACVIKLPKLSYTETATFNMRGASILTVAAETKSTLLIDLSGASVGELTLKGGSLRTSCTGASTLKADVSCTKINANCDGASRTSFSGTADEVEIDRGGVSVNIDTSHLNQF